MTHEIILAFLCVFGAVLHWQLSLALHTFFLHRYHTHGQFSMSVYWQRFFYILTFLLQGPAFLKPETYRKLHLAHHEFSDTEYDPHSPSNYLTSSTKHKFWKPLFAMMLDTKKIFEEIQANKHWISGRYGKKIAIDWKGFETVSNSKEATLLMGALYILLWCLVIPYWILLVFLPIILLNGPLQGAIVNWFGHVKGTRNFDIPDNSKNTPGAPLMNGELYQNNHHQFPESPNLGCGPGEFDPIYHLMIRPLLMLRIIHLSQKAKDELNAIKTWRANLPKSPSA